MLNAYTSSSFSKPRTILITAGGTGGHFYPAVALAKELMRVYPSWNIWMMGGGLNRGEELLTNLPFSYYKVAASPLTLRKPLSFLKELSKIFDGAWESYKWLQKMRPDLVVGFGSYHTVPVLLAALAQRCPILLHEGNSIFGKVNRLFKPVSIAVGTQFPHSSIPHVTLPLREGYSYQSVTKENARTYFGLKKEGETLLIFGGSQGASFLNQMVLESIAKMPQEKLAKLQVMHWIGNKESVPCFQKSYQEIGVLACVKAFEERMDLAWQAADFTIARAGALTCAEALTFQMPTLLIPYPKAADNHQVINAQFMQNEVKGSVYLEESTLSPSTLHEVITRQLYDPLFLASMRENIEKFHQKHRATTLCEFVLQQIGKLP